MASTRVARHPITALIVLALFALFTWGFAYNLLKRVGFTEATSQITGATLGLIAIIAIEGFSRLRLRRLSPKSE